MSNPYQPPREISHRVHDHRRTYIALIPFLISFLTLIAVIVIWVWSPDSKNVSAVKPLSVVFGVLGTVLAFALPVSGWILFHWWANGEPPELTLSPLFPTRQEREFHRRLAERPDLSDDEFYERFYGTSPIPKSLVAKLRRSLECAFGLEFGALHPTDNMIDADHEVDWADIIWRINRDFGIAISEERIANSDGTFDSLVRCVAEMTAPTSGSKS